MEFTMFGFFKKQDKVISDLLRIIEQCRSDSPEEVKQIADPLFLSLSTTIEKQWKTEDIKNYKSQIESGEKHEAFIFNFIIHSTANTLESGRCHVYRGVLNTQGSLYKQLFEHSIETMISKNEYTKEWADINLRASVYKGIKEAG
jgi:hypothetical protein